MSISTVEQEAAQGSSVTKQQGRACFQGLRGKFCLCRNAAVCQHLSMLSNPWPKDVYVLMAAWCYRKWPFDPMTVNCRDFKLNSTFVTEGTKLPLEILIFLKVTRCKSGLTTPKYTFCAEILGSVCCDGSEFRHCDAAHAKCRLTSARAAEHGLGSLVCMKTLPCQTILNHPTPEQRSSGSFFKFLHGWILVPCYSTVLLS